MEMFLAIQKQTGKVSEELTKLPNLPPESAHVWRWWMAMHGKRQRGMALEPIGWADAQAYFGLIDTQPRQWEVDALDRLDSLYLWTQNPRSEEAVKGFGALKRSNTRSD